MTQYIVKMRCVVTKQVICEDCTAEQAESDPWAHAVDEIEVDQVDWEVLGVEESP